MKKVKNVIIGLSIIIGFAGCAGASWVNLDKSDATSNKINNAKAKCNVNEKEETIRTKNAVHKVIMSARNGLDNKSIIKKHEDEIAAINNEITSCMKKEGLIWYK